MLFNQLEFIFFFVLVMAFCRFVKNHRLKKLFLLAGSYYFYAYWDWRFLSLILISTLVDYTAGLALARTDAPRLRKVCLLVSLMTNLGLLGFFKYFGFFVESLAAALAPLNLEVSTLNIILPVGISFYTFQTLSYTIDIYRKRLEPCTDFFDFALFVAFFPQLVAGPIVRASDFLPQLKTAPKMNWTRTYLGFRQFVFGLFKKVYIADGIASFVDLVFANAGIYDAPTTWLAVFGYSVQIYCDFSGYSDMAIGAARILGYDFGENFRHPYIASSIQDFWRRWHISLSTWLRDYLYIPLGGSRIGRVRTHVNLMLTMLLGGLWHGAAWNFVFWGALHGSALAVCRFWAERWPAKDPETAPAARKLLGWASTMLVVMVAWVFFRSESFGQSWLMLHQMFAPAEGIRWLPVFPIFAILIVVGGHLLHAIGRERLLDLRPNTVTAPAVLFSLIWLALVYYPKDFKPFLYFQF